MQSKDDDLLDLQLMWTSHVEVLLKVMQTLRHKEVFADATLICGNKRFEVHQFVLSTCSLYLETLFRISPGNHPVLMLPDAPPTAMEQLLDFMYLGQTDVTSGELNQLLDLAEDLRIIGLMHSSSSSLNQSQTTINQELKTEKAVHKNRSATSVNKTRSAAAARKTPKKITKLKSQTSSVNQKISKDHVAARRHQGRASVDKNRSAPTGEKNTKKITERKILQDNEKNTLIKSFSAKKSEKNKDEQILHVCKICQQEFKTVRLHKDHMKLHYEKCLLSCPECPFKALSSAVMNQHINKHLVGKPYICPHCQLRHPLIELHIAHQKRSHPKMQIIVNKSPVVKLEESMNTRHEPGDDHSVKHTNVSSLSHVSLASLLGPVRDERTENQTVSQHSTCINYDSSVSSHAEVHYVGQDSVLKTEMPLQTEPVSKNEMPPQIEPVSKNEMLLQAEPVSKNEMPPQIEPVSKNEMLLQTEPVLKNEMLPQAEPVSKNEMLLQAEPVSKNEMLLQTELVSKNEMLLQAEPVSKNEMLVQAEPVSKNEMLLQIEPVTKTEGSLQAEPVAKPRVSLQAEPVIKMEMQLEPEPVAKIEMPQQVEALSENEMFPQPSEMTSSELSTLQSADSFTLSTSSSLSTSITKGCRKRKFSALGGKAGSKISCSRKSALSSRYQDTIMRRKSPRLHREKS